MRPLEPNRWCQSRLPCYSIPIRGPKSSGGPQLAVPAATTPLCRRERVWVSLNPTRALQAGRDGDRKIPHPQGSHLLDESDRPPNQCPIRDRVLRWFHFCHFWPRPGFILCFWISSVRLFFFLLLSCCFPLSVLFFFWTSPLRHVLTGEETSSRTSDSAIQETNSSSLIMDFETHFPPLSPDFQGQKWDLSRAVTVSFPSVAFGIRSSGVQIRKKCSKRVTFHSFWSWAVGVVQNGDREKEKRREREKKRGALHTTQSSCTGTEREREGREAL